MLRSNTAMQNDFEFHPELIERSSFIAPTATVLGHVEIGQESSIWYGAVVRGDSERIHIGRRTNVQDLCVIHADPGYPCVLGDAVTVGHAAIVHGAYVEDNVMIGMHAVVMNGARIGEGSIVGVGSVVTEGKEIPPGSVVLGVPAKVARSCSDVDLERVRSASRHYVEAMKAAGGAAERGQ